MGKVSYVTALHGFMQNEKGALRTLLDPMNDKLGDRRSQEMGPPASHSLTCARHAYGMTRACYSLIQPCNSSKRFKFDLRLVRAARRWVMQHYRLYEKMVDKGSSRLYYICQYRL